jgi:MFS family permease
VPRRSCGVWSGRGSAEVVATLALGAVLLAVSASYLELALALLVAGVGISMALPTVPTAVLSAVAPEEVGKASGVNTMMQRFGSVFAVAIATAVFTAYGHLGSPAAVTDGFKPALGVCAALSLLGTLTALAIARQRAETTLDVQREPAPAIAASN